MPFWMGDKMLYSILVQYFPCYTIELPFSLFETFRCTSSKKIFSHITLHLSLHSSLLSIYTITSYHTSSDNTSSITVSYFPISSFLSYHLVLPSCIQTERLVVLYFCGSFLLPLLKGVTFCLLKHMYSFPSREQACQLSGTKVLVEGLFV